ncbi:MAG: transposase [Candidatus Wallbacteria bacterium]|nr:transposase [Candidatus Wallbacteria bacterium]
MKKRKSMRLAGFDYGSAGAYFITICTRDRECLFGAVIQGTMKPNDAGLIVVACWHEIVRHFTHVKTDAFAVMPNHVHGILLFAGNKAVAPASVGAQHAAPLHGMAANVIPGTLGAAVRSYKAAVTRNINTLHGTPGISVWQRNYYDHIIRDDAELNRIREYIVNNPLNWDQDEENPDCAKGAQDGRGASNPMNQRKTSGGEFNE